MNTCHLFYSTLGKTYTIITSWLKPVLQIYPFWKKMLIWPFLTCQEKKPQFDTKRIKYTINHTSSLFILYNNCAYVLLQAGMVLLIISTLINYRNREEIFYTFQNYVSCLESLEQFYLPLDLIKKKGIPAPTPHRHLFFFSFLYL